MLLNFFLAVSHQYNVNLKNQQNNQKVHYKINIDMENLSFLFVRKCKLPFLLFDIIFDFFDMCLLHVL